jgi:hypothetical protein
MGGIKGACLLSILCRQNNRFKVVSQAIASDVMFRKIMISGIYVKVLKTICGVVNLIGIICVS